MRTKSLALGTILLAATLPLSEARGHHPDHDHGVTDSPDGVLARQDPHTDMMLLDQARHAVEGAAVTLNPATLSSRAGLMRNLAGAGSARINDDDDDDDDDDDQIGLELISRGSRLAADGTTDVWTHDGFGYTGTFNSPCGGEEGAGIWVWDLNSGSVASLVTVIASPVGSRTNDVKVTEMNSGNILVHSNEPCNGGPGGFEVYNVDDPGNPLFLASVTIDELNPISNALFGGISDVGVHNLWLFTQGRKDYVGVVAESGFDNFRIYDITGPAPVLAGAWGAEESFDPGVGDLTDITDPAQVNRVLAAALWLTDGFGASQNRFLHDITLNADGTLAYLSNWDAGLVLLDVSDPTDPQLVSVAIDPTVADGEVNSHAAWPSEDGSIVVETEEDFSPFALDFSLTSGPNAGSFPGAEGSFSVPIADLPGRQMSGSSTYGGFGCNPGTAPGFDDPVPPGTGIAVIQRGACDFVDKAKNAIDAGYSGLVVFNDAARGDGLVVMSGNPRNIPAIFVGHSTGLAAFDVATAADLVIGAAGADISASVIADGWGYVRVWDYSDPGNPILASTFDTVCSANPDDPSCDPLGTYSVHNVIVETDGDWDDDDDGQVKAYISWYWDGVLILDVTDPYNPVELARFSRTDPAFEAQNGGHQDFWGIYKERNEEQIYASDRNGGLYVFEESDDFDEFWLAANEDDD